MRFSPLSALLALTFLQLCLILALFVTAGLCSMELGHSKSFYRAYAESFEKADPLAHGMGYTPASFALRARERAIAGEKSAALCMLVGIVLGILGFVQLWLVGDAREEWRKAQFKFREDAS